MLQILYYSICVFILSLSLVYISCAVVVFFRDLTQIINIGLQVGVWLTPIMWVADTALNEPSADPEDPSAEPYVLYCFRLQGCICCKTVVF